MNIHIKICGINRLSDALLAEKIGASAVGFVFYHKSRRYVDPEKAGKISEKLGPFIARVGVFVDETPALVIKTVQTAQLTTVQLHCSEGPEYVRELSKEIQVIKAFRVGKDFDINNLSKYKENVKAFLLDTYSENGCYGGTGKTFDWKKAAGCGKYGKIILAGGLNASNVQQAIKIAKPWGVDVSSGIEREPGIKDPKKMRAFFAAVREVNSK